MTPGEIRAMNERIAARRAAAPSGSVISVYGPRWAEKVIDNGSEVIAIHKDTAEPYPLDVHADLSLEDHCALVIRRVIAAGGGAEELGRLVRAFGLDPTAQHKLAREIREAES
jgi:hypothetical protein